MVRSIKLSIVIPYYNTYDLTVKLLKQLRIQVTDEVEVILVDDGCHETRFDEYDFVTVIHNETNLGAPQSWNKGIDIAQGEYIGFIDSDDTIVPYYIEELLKAIAENDIDEIEFGWIDINRNYLISQPKNVAIWKAIYRREKCPHFREEWKYQSDIPFQWDLHANKPTKMTLNKSLYLYNSDRTGSLTWERLRQRDYRRPRLHRDYDNK